MSFPKVFMILVLLSLSPLSEGRGEEVLPDSRPLSPLQEKVQKALRSPKFAETFLSNRLATIEKYKKKEKRKKILRMAQTWALAIRTQDSQKIKEVRDYFQEIGLEPLYTSYAALLLDPLQKNSLQKKELKRKIIHKFEDPKIIKVIKNLVMMGYGAPRPLGQSLKDTTLSIQEGLKKTSQKMIHSFLLGLSLNLRYLRGFITNEEVEGKIELENLSFCEKTPSPQSLHPQTEKPIGGLDSYERATRNSSYLTYLSFLKTPRRFSDIFEEDYKKKDILPLFQREAYLYPYYPNPAYLDADPLLIKWGEVSIKLLKEKGIETISSRYQEKILSRHNESILKNLIRLRVEVENISYLVKDFQSSGTAEVFVSNQEKISDFLKTPSGNAEFSKIFRTLSRFAHSDKINPEASYNPDQEKYIRDQLMKIISEIKDGKSEIERFLEKGAKKIQEDNINKFSFQVARETLRGPLTYWSRGIFGWQEWALYQKGWLMPRSPGAYFADQLANEAAILIWHKTCKESESFLKKWVGISPKTSQKKIDKKGLPQNFKLLGADLGIGLALNGACHLVRSALRKVFFSLI